MPQITMTVFDIDKIEAQLIGLLGSAHKIINQVLDFCITKYLLAGIYTKHII